MTQVRVAQGNVIDPAVAATFAAAIGSYSRSLHGQATAAAALSDQVTICWIDGVSDVLAALDRLRDQVSAPGPDTDVRASVTTLAAFVEERLTGLMAEVQRQDMVRQMLAAMASMAGAIGDLDLADLVTSTEAAMRPRRIVEDTEAAFVMDAQRRAGATPGPQVSDPGLEILF